MPNEVLEVIGNILTEELGLATGQIMFTNERFTIPETNGLYIALSYIGGKPIANNNYSVPTVGGMDEHQETTMLYQVQIDLMSFDASARQRKEEIYQALASVYAEQQMEANEIQLARIPSGFVDASSLEETKYLNRYTLTIAVTALLTKVKAVPYYDTFQAPEVHANE